MSAYEIAAAHPDLALADEDFREEVRAWIKANYPLDVRHATRRIPFERSRPWFERLRERGWLAPGWPVEHGGIGLSPFKRLILTEEMERFGAVRLNDMGVIMVGPLLMVHGTEAQRRRFLPKILTGEHRWCQGYSEPNAGSDLASLRSEAVLDDEEWVINGEKIWTTRGADSNWMFGLFRTSREGRKQDGISFILIPMDTPGLTVRPLPDIAGDAELCQTVLENVRVPRENLVGAPGKGWEIANALLRFERIGLGSPKHSEYALALLGELMVKTGGWASEAVLDRYVQLRMDLEDHSALYQQFVSRMKTGEELGPDVSILKIHQTELYQRITDMLVAEAEEEAGLQGYLPETSIAVSEQFLYARPTTIYGGTSEIQRTVVATRVLGLPRS